MKVTKTGGERMSEREVYLIANLVIENAQAYRVYEKGFFP